MTASHNASGAGVGVLDAFDKAVAAELPRVSHLEYDSHEICKHFASKVRERLGPAPPATDAPIRPFDWKRFAAMVADAMLSEGWGHAGFGESELREDVETAVQNAFNGMGVEAASPPAGGGDAEVELPVLQDLPKSELP